MTSNFLESKESTKEVLDPAKEVLDFFDNNGVQVSPRLRSLLDGSELRGYYRSGTEFTQASGHLIRTLTRPDTLSRYEAFGLCIDDFGQLEADIEKEITLHTLDDNLSDSEIRELVRLELFEIAKDPSVRYRSDLGMANLEDLGLSPAAYMLLDICRQAFSGKEEPADYSFDRSRPKQQCLFCKDSEFYMAARLNNSFKFGYNANCSIFCEGNIPVFFQKTGGYKVDYDSDGDNFVTNATALTLQPIKVGGIVLPPGTLVGLETDIDVEGNGYGDTYITKGYDQKFDVSRITGVIPLRLSIFTLEADEQERGFRQHYLDFKDTVEGWGGEVPTLEDFVMKAKGLI